MDSLQEGIRCFHVNSCKVRKCIGLSIDAMGIIDSNKGKKRILPHCSQGDSDCQFYN